MCGQASNGSQRLEVCLCDRIFWTSGNRTHRFGKLSSDCVTSFDISTQPVTDYDIFFRTIRSPWSCWSENRRAKRRTETAKAPAEQLRACFERTPCVPILSTNLRTSLETFEIWSVGCPVVQGPKALLANIGNMPGLIRHWPRHETHPSLDRLYFFSNSIEDILCPILAASTALAVETAYQLRLLLRRNKPMGDRKDMFLRLSEMTEAEQHLLSPFHSSLLWVWRSQEVSSHFSDFSIEKRVGDLPRACSHAVLWVMPNNMRPDKVHQKNFHSTSFALELRLWNTVSLPPSNPPSSLLKRQSDAPLLTQ